MDKKTIRDIDVSGKRVLVRVDLNVPLDDETNAVTDDSRVQAVLPTIRYLIDHNAKVILCSHLGRPEGKVVANLRLAPVGTLVGTLLGRAVVTASDCVGPEAEAAVGKLPVGGVLLLENLRFHLEEGKNDPTFARSLAQLADVYVNDAFGTAHRAHASTVGVTQYLPAVAGLLMEKEIDIMGRALSEPARPFAVVIGGAKVSDKIRVLEHLLDKVDVLLIGGGMACTFLKAQKHEIGRSLVEEERLDFASSLVERAKAKGIHLLLPVDVVIGDRFAADASSKAVSVDEVPADWQIMDIGARTVERFEAELKPCKTVIWNGPMGVFEFPKFRKGTEAVAAILANLSGTTIVGGGSTAEAVEEMGFTDKMTHVSTGGGASLEFLEGRTLPGVAALLDR